MIKKILKPFLGRGIGGFLPVKYLSRLFIFLFNPFEIEGSKLYLPLDEIQFFTGYEKEKVKIFKDIIKENDVVVDLGAHIGYYTMIAAKLVGKKGMIYGFEPGRVNFALLQKNKEKNEYNNIVLEKKAVSDKNGKNKLYFWGASRDQRLYGGDDQPFVEIENVRLDDYFKDYIGKIDFIKINIAGSEGAAIHGMAGLLKKNPNVKLMILYSPKRISELGGNPIDSLNLLEKLGFKTWLIKKELEPVNKIEKLIEDDTTKELFCRR